jgi:hypothetical protein
MEQPSLTAGLARLAGEFIEPKCEGKVSIIGERELGSKVAVESTVRPTPPIPNPLPSCTPSSSGVGVGGVGVRGGAGIGKLDAMAALYQVRGIMSNSRGDRASCCFVDFQQLGANIQSD